MIKLIETKVQHFFDLGQNFIKNKINLSRKKFIIESGLKSHPKRRDKS